MASRTNDPILREIQQYLIADDQLPSARFYRMTQHLDKLDVEISSLRQMKEKLNEFRSALRGLGINPDDPEEIAAAIAADGSGGPADGEIAGGDSPGEVPAVAAGGKRRAR